MPFYLWSQTAASNGSADPSCSFPEGMAPSAVNDSSRGAMASLKKWGDDIAGAILTAGSATAYTVASYSGFDTLAHLDKQMIAFTAHATNGQTVTLNCDSLGAKPLRTSPAAELQPGTLIQGTPYVAVYNNSDGVFYLQGFYGNPYNIPLGGMLDYTTLSVPNSSFVFPVGQALSRTVYAALFAAYSTYYGAGDGTTTFNIIDMRGRVGIAPDGGAGRMAGVGLNGAGGVNGAVQALAATNLPPHIHSGQTGGQSNDHTHTSTTGVRVGGNFFPGGNGYDVGQQGETSSGSSQDHSHAFTTNGGAGLNGTAFSVAMPYVGVNKILRVI